MTSVAPPDPTAVAEAHERLVALIMQRDGVSREEAEEVLRRAEAEALRMRDA